MVTKLNNMPAIVFFQPFFVVFQVYKLSFGKCRKSLKPLAVFYSKFVFCREKFEILVTHLWSGKLIRKTLKMSKNISIVIFVFFYIEKFEMVRLCVLDNVLENEKISKTHNSCSFSGNFSCLKTTS